jgi:hypothetical protein
VQSRRIERTGGRNKGRTREEISRRESRKRRLNYNNKKHRGRTSE